MMNWLLSIARSDGGPYVWLSKRPNVPKFTSAAAESVTRGDGWNGEEGDAKSGRLAWTKGEATLRIENLHPWPVRVVCTLDPHGAREGVLDLDLEALGMRHGDNFAARDLVSGQTWVWGQYPYVRLDPHVQVAHIIHVRPGAV